MRYRTQNDDVMRASGVLRQQRFKIRAQLPNLRALDELELVQVFVNTGNKFRKNDWK